MDSKKAIDRSGCVHLCGRPSTCFDRSRHDDDGVLFLSKCYCYLVQVWLVFSGSVAIRLHAPPLSWGYRTPPPAFSACLCGSMPAAAAAASHISPTGLPSARLGDVASAGCAVSFAERKVSIAPVERRIDRSIILCFLPKLRAPPHLAFPLRNANSHHWFMCVPHSADGLQEGSLFVEESE